jgi:septal ring-binding cell division protein DamX
MVANKAFISSARTLANNVQSHATSYALITEERTQKLELLLHLLANSTQSLVICGSSGIGKTTVLKSVPEQGLDTCSYQIIQGKAELSLESMKDRLGLAAKTSPERQTIVLLDDAGKLPPGMISAIVEWGSAIPGFRMVFVLTHDELHVKSRTDVVIDDFHVIEIPSLTELQCGDFLRQLSAKPWSKMPLSAINDTMVRNVYLSTHGVPGRIIADLPALSNSTVRVNSLGSLLLAVVALVGVALGLQWFSKTPINLNRTKVETFSQLTSISIPEGLMLQVKRFAWEDFVSAELDDWLLSLSEDKSGTQTNDKTSKLANSPVMTNTPAFAGWHYTTVANTPAMQANVPAILEPSAVPFDKSLADSMEWLKSQNHSHFTVRIKSVATKAQLEGIVQKFPSQAEPIRYIKIQDNKAKETYLMFYGSYMTIKSAEKAKRNLPAEFSQASVKKISTIIASTRKK